MSKKVPSFSVAGPVAHPDATSGITPPDHLSIAAKGEWTRVAGILHERGMLDKFDAAGLADYAECWGRLQECEREISARGLLVSGRDGGLVRNPAIAAAKNYRDALMKWCKGFNMTPLSRKQAQMRTIAAKTQNRFQAIADEMKRVN